MVATGPFAAPKPNEFAWSTVVNNNDPIPNVTPPRNFNSYNQPSVNLEGNVVIRARSRGGPPQGPATHGVYTRDMSLEDSPVVRILDRTTPVPGPNNLGTTFVETPSFPRIDMASDTIATRGNHQPAWRYSLDDGSETRSGTTGVYANPFGPLITGVGKLGHVSEFSFMEVPEFPGTQFEVFPGAPSVTLGDTIVFKGNYTVGDIGKTGVYFRKLDDQPIYLSDNSMLSPAGGESRVVLIANNTDTVIPGTHTVFGSTAPPSAAGNRVVFSGFDNEEMPTLGGIYLAPLQFHPALTTLVGIGDQVPKEAVGKTFTLLGEGNAFDGRYVGFWGAWGTVMAADPLTGKPVCVQGCRDKLVHCPTEGNKDRIAFCLEQCPEPAGCTMQVPVQQGIFIHDTRKGWTVPLAKTGAGFDEFLYWNFSGKVPGVGEGEEGGEDDGEPARWRSSAFVAVSGSPGAAWMVAFKGTKNGRVGIHLGKGPVSGRDRDIKREIKTVLEIGMDGRLLDPEAPAGSTIVELGIEREGLRGKWLAISAKMGLEGSSEEEDEDMAGVYVTRIPDNSRR